MDTLEFWTVIEAARSSSTADRPFAESLVDQLATRTEADILRYEERFEEVHGALCRWDVWAAAYLIGGGCSDDSFMDFRAGLIALGKDWYEKAASNPDSLAEHPAVVAAAADAHHVEALFYEDVSNAANAAFVQVTGSQDADAFYEAWDACKATGDESAQDTDDMGEDFDFDDADEMRHRLPRLAALFLRDSAR